MYPDRRADFQPPWPLTCFLSPLPPGETTTTVAPQVPGGVSDGRWHTVQVQYYNKVGRPTPLPAGPRRLSARDVDALKL